MATTQAEIDALDTAIKSGVQRFRHNERDTWYRSLAEMKQALADMKAELNNSPPLRRIYFTHSKGLR